MKNSQELKNDIQRVVTLLEEKQALSADITELLKEIETKHNVKKTLARKAASIIQKAARDNFDTECANIQGILDTVLLPGFNSAASE